MPEGDRMAAEEDGHDSTHDGEAELLELVSPAPRGQAHRLRAGRALGIAAAVGLLAVLVSWNGRAEPASDTDNASSATTENESTHRVFGEETASTTGGSSSPSTTSGDATGGGPGAASEGPGSEVAAPEPSAPAAPAPTSTTVCANSFDPDCGPFRWSSSVGANRPVQVSIELLTDDPVVGELIEFRVRVSDPDATPIGVGSPWKGPVGHDHELTPGNCYWHGVYEGFGSWTPPARRPGSIDMVTGSKVTVPGTVRFTFCIATMSWERYPAGASDEEAQTWCPGDPSTVGMEGFTCRDPYGSFATPYIDVVVADAP